MNYFLSGGAKNGKSSLAQRIICAQPGPRYYLATMIPHDDEDLLRIRRHIDDRAGLGFTTVECGTDVLSALGRMDPGGAVLLDSVTALLSNEMFRADGTLDADAPERLERELLAFSRQMRCCVFVSDYIYADGGQYDAWTEAYRRGLARLDRALAAACENAAALSNSPFRRRCVPRLNRLSRWSSSVFGSVIVLPQYSHVPNVLSAEISMSPPHILHLMIAIFSSFFLYQLGSLMSFQPETSH